MTRQRPPTSDPGREPVDRRDATGHADATTSGDLGGDHDEGLLLASALSWNAIFSGASGLVLVGAGVALSGVLGVPTWLLAVIGAGLLGFAALILWTLAGPSRLVTGARLIIAADVGWVAGAVLLLTAFPEALTTAGRLILGAVSVVVAVLALTQSLGLRRAKPGPVSGASPIHLQVESTIAAPVDHVWAAVADAGDYARFAGGIAETTIVSGEGEGMVRVCRDDQGGSWSERCTLWEAGRRYRMTVDVASYPAYYRALLHGFAQTWTVDPVAAGTHVTLSFDGAVKLGVIGRFAARLLGNRRRLEAILAAYDRELTSHRRDD